MSYKCSRCKRDVELDEYGGVRCPYCGHRVLLKERGGGIRKSTLSSRVEHHGAPSGDAPHAHTASLSFTYPDERRARIVAESVAVEVGDIDDARSAATVDRNGDTLTVTVHAADLVALRAGVDSWTRMVGVAEEVADVASAAGVADVADESQKPKGT